MLEVQRSVLIRRPVRIVREQFADVAYHEQRGHHRGTRFSVVEVGGDVCIYEQVTAVGPFRIRQRFRLKYDDPGRQVNELISGAFAPGSITFEIEGDTDETTVTATLRSERRGLARFLAPLFRRALGRSLQQALEEDRVDLESGDYEQLRSAS